GGMRRARPSDTVGRTPRTDANPWFAHHRVPGRARSGVCRTGHLVWELTWQQAASSSATTTSRGRRNSVPARSCGHRRERRKPERAAGYPPSCSDHLPRCHVPRAASPSWSGEICQVLREHLRQRLRSHILLAVALTSLVTQRLPVLIPGHRHLDALVALTLLVVFGEMVRASAHRLQRLVRCLDGQTFLPRRLQQLQLALMPIAQGGAHVVSRPREATCPEEDENPPDPVHPLPLPLSCCGPA